MHITEAWPFKELSEPRLEKKCSWSVCMECTAIYSWNMDTDHRRQTTTQDTCV